MSGHGTGRVEVFYDGVWGTICDEGWDLRDTRVVCHQLGYPDAVRSLNHFHVPMGFARPATIWLSEVACTGEEQNISSCSHAGWGENSCIHFQDVGVQCSGKGKRVVFTKNRAIQKKILSTILC